MLILDLWGISFHPAVVVGLGNDLLFNSILGHCEKLEPSCCKKQQKSPNQETGLGNRGYLKVLIDTKLILND
jgi:hypothetical protein